MKTITIGKNELTIAEAKKMIFEQLETITKDEQFKNLVKSILTVQSGQKGPRPESKQTLFREMLLTGPVSEEKLWTDWKWGRHEALSVAWYYRQEKYTKPENFLWVWFNVETRCYEVLGQGPEVPEYYMKKATKKADKKSE